MLSKLKALFKAPIEPTAEDVTSDMKIKKFNLDSHAPQDAVDIFHGRWASDLGQVVPGVRAGATGLFEDPRVGFLLNRFADSGGKLHGKRVLELGPLEGAHTYQLEKLGAEVTAIEANTEAYLKCLVVKELTGLSRARFLYGDFIEYLRGLDAQFDIILCSGVLYHMFDPVSLIEQIAGHTNRVFVWTHYYDEEQSAAIAPEVVQRNGETYTYYRHSNTARPSGVYWGGGQPTSARLSRDDLLRAFRNSGFSGYHVHEDDKKHPGGPCMSISLWKN